MIISPFKASSKCGSGGGLGALEKPDFCSNFCLKKIRIGWLLFLLSQKGQQNKSMALCVLEGKKIT
jgi:hypothetical protein